MTLRGDRLLTARLRLCRSVVNTWWMAAISSVAMAACVRPAGHSAAASRPTNDQEGVEIHAKPDVGAARELDHEGVRSFREGRFADAIRYFRAAHRLGGPSSELSS